GDDAEQRRLAAAARPEQGGERPRGHLDRHAVEGREVAEPLDDVPGDDHRVSSFGLKRVMSSSTAIASIASTTEAAYAPTRSKLWNRSSTWIVIVCVSPTIR